MRRITGWTSALCLAWGLVALGGPAGAVDITNDPNAQNTQETGSYGYLRTVESAATLIQAGSNDRTPAEVNQPVMVGDRIQVPGGSKAELILPDHNLVRLDGGSDLVLEHLAGSPDANDRATVLNLLEGNVQLVVTEDSLGDELPRVDTPNTSVYPQDFGSYRIATTREGWTEVTVRNGKAQVVTDQSSENLRAGEQAIVEAEIDVHEATGMDGLERWALRLDQDSAQQADLGSSGDNDSGGGFDEVSVELRYAAAPLNRYGGWVTVQNQRYWRPRVSEDWRPYTDGRWVYTPSGMTWVSSEPWGWVPYHYGSWDFVPGFGWLWQPGSVYAPAWVYWYWGPSYTGWCPMGYYTRYYASAGFGGFHAGLYGWAGGDWAVFSRWTFVPSSYWRGYHDGYRNGFRDGRHHWDQWDVRRHAVPIQELQRGGHPLERGLITTDTHRLRPDTWTDPNRAVQVLRDSGGRPGRQGGELPDVSSFVARKPQLPPNVAQIVKAGPDDINRYVGTPLRPNTLGRGEHAGGRGVRGARVTPVPQNQPGAGGVTGNSGERPGRRPVPWTPPQAPGVEGGGAQQPGRPGRNGGGPRVTPITPVTPPTAEQPAPDNRPRPRRPAPGDQGGAPRPDRGGRETGPRVTPVTPPPTTDRTPRTGRPAPGDQGGAPRPDHGNPANVDRGNNRGGQTDRGNQGTRDRGNQGNQDRGNREKASPPPPPKQEEKEKDKKPPYQSYYAPDRPAVYGDRTGAVDRSSSPRPVYAPRPQPQPVYRPAAPPVYRPAERMAPPPSRPQPQPAPQRAPAPSSNPRPAERHAEPPKPERHDGH